MERKSTRVRKTSRSFLLREFDLSHENESNDEEFEQKILEIQQTNERKSKRIFSDIISPPTQSSLMPALCCEPILDMELLKKRKTISSTDNIKFIGNIEYVFPLNNQQYIHNNTNSFKQTDDGDVYTIEQFKFKTNRNKGYCFETERFSINNFGIGNHLFFFLKKKNAIPFDLVFKISPCENKIEVTNDVLHFESSSSNNNDNNTLFVDSSTKNYIKKNDAFYPDVDLLFSSKKKNHLELVFRDVNTKIPFCTFNIETKI